MTVCMCVCVCVEQDPEVYLMTERVCWMWGLRSVLDDWMCVLNVRPQKCTWWLCVLNVRPQKCTWWLNVCVEREASEVHLMTECVCWTWGLRSALDDWMCVLNVRPQKCTWWLNVCVEREASEVYLMTECVCWTWGLRSALDDWMCVLNRRSQNKMLILQKAIQQSEEKELITQNELANVIRIVSPFFVHCFVSYKNLSLLCIWWDMCSMPRVLHQIMAGCPLFHFLWLFWSRIWQVVFVLGVPVRSTACSKHLSWEFQLRAWHAVNICPGNSNQEHGMQ